MKAIWQKRQAGNESLLIFFTGWGTTPEVAQHLVLPEGWDYLACYDYRTVESTDLPSLSDYRQTYIAAWSMGVWAADLLAPYLPLPQKAIAINGTPLPMHDLYGIPDQIFRGTLEGLDDANRARFNRRMCGGKALLQVFNSFSQRSTENLRSELMGVYQQVEARYAYTPPRLHWTKAIISTKDLIVPAPNQLRYWRAAATPTLELEGAGHYPLTAFTHWAEIVEGV